MISPEPEPLEVPLRTLIVTTEGRTSSATEVAEHTALDEDPPEPRSPSAAATDESADAAADDDRKE